MNVRTVTIHLASALFLTACFGSAEDPTPPVASSSSVSTSSSVEVRETNNVSYTGTIRTQRSESDEGTHRLVLESGRVIFLESDSVDINGYVGENAEVLGALRPTENDGMIIRVERISLVEDAEDESSSNESSSSESSSDSSAASVVSDSSSSVTSSSSSESSESTSSDTTSLEDVLLEVPEDQINEPDAPEQVNETDRFSTPEVMARIETMAKEDIAQERWTQQYCSSHIEFCIPVHKNWWFNSFGSTSTSLWTVELSSEPINAIGDGPIVVRLLSGDLADLGIEDGSVLQRQTTVVGYKAWTYGRHFEVVADSSLRGSVDVILGGFTSNSDS